MNLSSTKAKKRKALINELTDVLHMLDDELDTLSNRPIKGKGARTPILKKNVRSAGLAQSQHLLPSDATRSTPIATSDVEILVDLLIERQLPKLRAELKQSILSEVHRIIPNK